MSFVVAQILEKRALVLIRESDRKLFYLKLNELNVSRSFFCGQRITVSK
jgi:hypothetical protein